jgi:ABC-type multidrug transport system fused ATPase/permease subunit
MSLSFSKNKLWKHLWLKSEIFLIGFIFFNLIISGLTGYFTPRLISEFYQYLNHQENFYQYFGYLAILFLVEYLNRFFYQIATHRYIQKLLTEIRKKSFSLWLKAPFKKSGNSQDDYPMGEVLARMMNDTDAVREVVSSGSFGIFIDIIFIISCLISFLQLNSSTGLALFVAEVLACIMLVYGSKAMGKVFMDVRRVTGQMARVVTDLTAGFKELFFSPNKNYASKRGEKIFEDFLTKQLHANIWDASYYSAAESLYPVLIALVMIIVPYAGIVEVAIIAVLIDLIQKSISPVKEVASKISVLQRAKSGLERLSEFNESFKSSQAESEDFSKLIAESLEFKLTTFQYEKGFNLGPVDFTLKRGEILGILGESGCGKSTLLKLLSGQYHTFNGSIVIDQKTFFPFEEVDLKKFSSYVSLVSQDSHVFTETIKFNVTLGYEYGFDEFWDLATNSIPYLHRWGVTPEFLINPKTLSMGQKQLLSGLRALFLKKPIILMDEISSGLDPELESAFRDLIKFFQSRSITIIVTHRLETILKSDKLLLLDSGKMLASGSHQALLNETKYKEFLSHL